MESLPASDEQTSTEIRFSPKRFAALFMGNGINADHWWAKGAGDEMEMLNSGAIGSVQEKVERHHGLVQSQRKRSRHSPGTDRQYLSGAALQKGAVLKGGVSMDQVLASRIGEDSPQLSLVLGCEQPITGYHETNFSMAYSSHISWHDANSPVPMESYPSSAFDSLFDNHGSRRMQSILDRVREHASHIRRQISAADQAKLDEYLTSVREIGKRIERTREDKSKADENAARRGQPVELMKRPDNGLPEDLREHMRLMGDIIATAFQTDKTRVATLLLCRDLSGLFYPFLDVRKAHHPASHDDLSDDY